MYEYEKRSYGNESGPLTLGEYVYICHHAGERYLDKHELNESGGRDALDTWGKSDGAKFFDPSWIDEIRSRNSTSTELPGQSLAQIVPETIVDLIESGIDNGLPKEIIAAQLADLYLPPSAILPPDNTDVAIEPNALDRQMLLDAWNQLLNNVDDDQWMLIETVFQSGNRIIVEFEDDSSVILSHQSSRIETSCTDSLGDPISSNWWDVDGNYGATTYDTDGSSSGTLSNPDGSYSTVENDGYNEIVVNDYAADGSYCSYTDDGYGNIASSDYAADGTLVDDNDFVSNDNDDTDRDADANLNQASNADPSDNANNDYNTDDSNFS